jgi:hypothetical protein
VARIPTRRRPAQLYRELLARGGREEGILARVGESWAVTGWTRRRMHV